MEGVVKWFNTRKGFGFIKGDDNEDYFVHHSALAQGTFLRDNDRVSFEPVQTDKGKQAKDVKLLQKGSEMAGSGMAGNHKTRRKEPEMEEREESEEF